MEAEHIQKHIQMAFVAAPNLSDRRLRQGSGTIPCRGTFRWLRKVLVGFDVDALMLQPKPGSGY